MLPAALKGLLECGFSCVNDLFKGENCKRRGGLTRQGRNLERRDRTVPAVATEANDARVLQ